MGQRMHKAEFDSMFISIFKTITEKGLPVDILSDTPPSKNTSITCYELERMIALCREDGSRELGVKRDEMVLLGMFPRMDQKGQIDIPAEREEYYLRNLEFYKDRLKTL